MRSRKNKIYIKVASRYVLCILTFSIMSCTPKSESEHLVDRPNIILIFADDLTHSAIGALGNDEIYTPNLDQLVQDGVSFTNTYNMGAWNGAVCAASRAMMISGRSVWRANQFRKNWGSGDSVFYNKSWGKLMEQSGYETYMTGKWHVDALAEQVFQNVRHVRPGMPKDSWNHHEMVRLFEKVVGKQEIDGKLVTQQSVMPNGYNRPLSPEDRSWSPTDPKFGGFWEGGKHWSEVLKDDAISFIDQAKTKDNPFFMYLAFNAPHDPRQAPKEYLDMYPSENISLPKSWQPLYPYKDDIGNGADLRDEALAPFPRSEFAIIQHIREYYAIITHMDEQIGQILEALDASGKRDNTYIFFTADHGLAIGKHGLLGKQSLFDHSIRPPLMIVGPDIPKGRKVKNDVYLQDIMATSLEIAGVKKPEYVEFNSFLAQAKGETDKGNYGEIYGAYINLQRMIRKDGFKLIVYPKINKVLLFDLKVDPLEMNNLADDLSYQNKVKSLFLDLLNLQKEMEDELDLQELYKNVSLRF